MVVVWRLVTALLVGLFEAFCLVAGGKKLGEQLLVLPCVHVEIVQIFILFLICSLGGRKKILEALLLGHGLRVFKRRSLLLCEQNITVFRRLFLLRQRCC